MSVEAASRPGAASLPGRSRPRATWPRLGREWPALATLAAAVLVVHRDALLFGRVFYETDTALFYYPLTAWLASHLQQGHLPLWLPAIFGGYPLLADGEVGPLYPLNLLALPLLGPAAAFVALRVLHVWLAAVFMYALMRVLGAARAGSLVAGLTFAFGGFLAPQVHHENVVRSAIWLPLVLLLAELALRRRGWARQRLLVAAGLALGLAMLGLHVQPVLMMVMALALYVGCRFAVRGSGSKVERLNVGGLKVGGWKVAPQPRTSNLEHPTSSLEPRTPSINAVLGAFFRAGWALGLILGVAATLAAAQWMPLYEWGRVSFRGQGVSYEFASAFATAPANLPSLLFPYFFRLPDGAWWTLWTPWETMMYAGVVPLLLAPLGLLRAPRRLGCYFAVLAGASLLIAMSHYGPLNLHEALWRLPGLSFLRAPGRFAYLVVFAVAGLAAFGADWLASARRGRRGLAVVAGLAAGLLAAVVWLLAAWRQFLLADPAQARQYLEATYLALRRQSPQMAVETVYGGLLWSVDLANPKTALSLGLLAALVCLLLVRLAVGRRARPAPAALVADGPSWSPATGLTWWSASLVVLVAVDLLVFAYDFHPRASLAELSRPSPLAEAVAASGGERLLAAPGLPGLEPNRPLLAGLQDLNGYSSLPSRRHFDYWSRVSRTPDSLLDLWGADRYVAGEPRVVEQDGYQFYPDWPLLRGPAGSTAGYESYALPDVPAASLALVGWLGRATTLPDGAPVGEVLVGDVEGGTERLTLLAGRDLAERAYDRPDVRPHVEHARPRVLSSLAEYHVDGSLFPAHLYVADLPLSQPRVVNHLTLRAVLPQGELTVFGLVLLDERGQPVHAVRPTDRDKLEPLQRTEAATIFRNRQAFPRAFAVYEAVGLADGRRQPPLVQMLRHPFDPARAVLLEHYPDPLPLIDQATAAMGAAPARPLAVPLEQVSTEHVRLRPALERPGFVVLTDQYHRGWEARVDGQPGPVFIADSRFVAVAVPPGQHVVDLVFNPLSLRLGVFLSMESLLFAALIFLAAGLATRRANARSRGAG